MGKRSYDDGRPKGKVTAYVFFVRHQHEVNKDIKLPFEKNLLMETNLGHRLRSWSAEHLFDGDMSKATSINDLRHIFINNFYKTEQSDEDRKLLSEFMSHSVKTQSYYKKDDVSGEVN